MPNWYINCIAAQILFEKHGFISPLRDNDHQLQGKFWVDFDYEEAPLLRTHSPNTRQPLHNLSVDDMLAMQVLPSRDARNWYVLGLMGYYLCPCKE